MHAVPQIANPFALLTDPEAIFRAVEASPRLESLNRRICRPLDRAHREEGADGNDMPTPGLRDVVSEQGPGRFLG